MTPDDTATDEPLRRAAADPAARGELWALFRARLRRMVAVRIMRLFPRPAP